MRQGAKATLQRGIVEAVGDFTTPMSLHAKQVNRIIVVTRHGRDACDTDDQFVQAQIRDRVAAAGLTIEFRFVGYQVLDDGERLKELTAQLKSQEPTFTNSPEELKRVLAWFTTIEPVLRSSQSVVNVLNPTVDKLNSASEALENGRFDLADNALAEARDAVVDVEIKDLDGRTSSAEAVRLRDLAVRLRTLQASVIEAADALLTSARSGRNLAEPLAVYTKAADGYNAVAREMTDALTSLRAQGPGGNAVKRWLLVAGAVVVVLGLVSGGLWVLLPPDHRTTFLVDASESADFGEVADAVGAAASNMSADDSLALRRFGGACDAGNTAELVPPGTGQAAEIGAAARAITPSGKATLLSGILAAIDDFARTYPFRGDQTNRVVVIVRGGVDACGKSAEEVRAIIEEHTAKAGVKIDFRFVGHRLTRDQVKVLNEIAAAADAQQPRLTKNSAELVTTMKEVSVPADLVAKEVKTSPCDAATPEVLLAAHKPQVDGARYFDIKCEQDRYLLARANNEQRFTDDLIAVFEFKDDTWQYVAAGTDLPCGQVPKDVWQKWDLRCNFDPVVCRDGESKVTVLEGWVDCPAAIDIADRYNAAIDAGQAQGQGLFWTYGEWSCSWPYEDGLAHSQVPLKCGRKSDRALVQIGDYQW